MVPNQIDILNRWLANTITPSEVVEAYRANALFDAHRDDPEFGHRLLADQARHAGESLADRTAWRISSANGWWSAFGKKRGRNGKKPGPAVHEDLCTVTDEHGRTRHEFTATEPNQLWPTDITEHKTSAGKHYLCAIKDVFGNKIAWYSIDSRMKASLAVNALNDAVAMRDSTLWLAVSYNMTTDVYRVYRAPDIRPGIVRRTQRTRRHR